MFVKLSFKVATTSRSGSIIRKAPPEAFPVFILSVSLARVTRQLVFAYWSESLIRNWSLSIAKHKWVRTWFITPGSSATYVSFAKIDEGSCLAISRTRTAFVSRSVKETVDPSWCIVKNDSMTRCPSWWHSLHCSAASASSLSDSESSDTS